jgi:hypothetical protein
MLTSPQEERQYVFPSGYDWLDSGLLLVCQPHIARLIRLPDKKMFDGGPADIEKTVFSPFPKGLQVVVGNPKLRTSNRTSDAAQATLWYVCDGDRSIYYPGFPVNRKCNKLTVGINFRELALPRPTWPYDAFSLVLGRSHNGSRSLIAHGLSTRLGGAGAYEVPGYPSQDPTVC